MKKLTFLFLMTFVIGLTAFAQQTTLTAEQQAAYTKTINQRAEKIVATLGITDQKKSARVRDIIAGQYRNLNDIYTKRDDKLNAAKQQSVSKDSMAAISKSMEADVNKSLDKLHKAYIAALSKELNASQVDKVKDGMTYGVLNVTYKGYEDMILDLKPEEKKQIMAWLVEAREHSMDAESSEKKHWWFGKYKGRINNYLSQKGYDLTQARIDWQKRIKEASAKQ
jgi:uncharacterized protein (DUF2267 family)